MCVALVKNMMRLYNVEDTDCYITDDIAEIHWRRWWCASWCAL